MLFYTLIHIVITNGCVPSLQTMMPGCRDRFIQGLVGTQTIRATPGVYRESQCIGCIPWAANPKHYTFTPHTHLTPVRANSTSCLGVAWRLCRWNPLRQPVLKVMTRFSQRFLQMAGKRTSSFSKMLKMNLMMKFPIWIGSAQVPSFKRILIRMVLRIGRGRTPEKRREKRDSKTVVCLLIGRGSTRPA